MSHTTKKLVRSIPFLNPLRRCIVAQLKKSTVKEWEKNGRPVPVPHYIKEQQLKLISEKFNLQTLVETGTYYGAMIEAQLKNFKEIHSIELSTELYDLAKKVFRFHKYITIHNGDSGKEIAKLLPKLNRPTLFWLDSHYSSGITAKGEKETPIFEELKAIAKFKAKLEFAIMIDDAREFGTNEAYPTLKQIEDFVKNDLPEYTCYVKFDVIFITK